MGLNQSFDPRADIPYPEQTDGHIRPFEFDDGTVFDKDYPYVDTSKKFRRKQFWTRVLLRLLVFPFSYAKMGLRVYGKKYLKKHKELLKQGTLSVCNHVNMWDYIAVMNAIKPFKPYILVLKGNVADKSGSMVRHVGGIPIPENDFAATKAYLEAIKDLLARGGWLHIYPEGSMWEYYRMIRPFKKGVAHLARMTDKPVVPLAFSYRKPSWFRRKLFHQIACFNLCIGEPLFLNKELPLAEQEEDLIRRCHEAVVSLAGLSEKENIYQPVFHNDKRIDYQE